MRTAILTAILATTTAACDVQDVQPLQPRTSPDCELVQDGSPIHDLARSLGYCDDGPAISDYDCARALANLLGTDDSHMWTAVAIYEVGCYFDDTGTHCPDLLALADDAQGTGPVGCAVEPGDFWACFNDADPSGVLPEITVAALCGALVMQ